MNINRWFDLSKAHARTIIDHLLKFYPDKGKREPQPTWKTMKLNDRYKYHFYLYVSDTKFMYVHIQYVK